MRGPARPEVWGAEVTSGCVKYVGGVTLLPSPSSLLLPPPLRMWVRPDRREPDALGRSFIFLKGKKWDGKEGNEPRSFRMNRIDNHCQQ